MADETKTFCVYPWIHQVALPPGTIGFCCVAKEGGPVMLNAKKRMKIPEVTLAEAWNSDYQRDIRKKMLAGEKVGPCQLCYYQESIGKESYRQMHNREWQEKAGPEIQQRIEESVRNDFRVEGGALYLDLRLGNLCNLKCRMCNPYNSTKIASETETLMQTDPEFAAVYSKYHDPHISKISKWYEEPSFWEGIYAQLPSLRKVYLTGGEPTLIKKNYEFLKKCVETGHSKHIFLMFNINCTNLSDEFISYLKHFEFVLINASIDGFNEVNEYIRGSSDWDLIDRNFRKLLQIGGPVHVGVTPTVQVYNVLNMVDLLEYIERTTRDLDRPANIDFLYVTDPPYLDIRILPLKVRAQALAKLESYMERSAAYIAACPNLENSLRSMLNVLRGQGPADEVRLGEFARYTRSLDISRKENFARSLPILHESLQQEGLSV